VYGALAWLLTMLAVVVAWVLFRAETLPGAFAMLRSMGAVASSQTVNAVLWNNGLSLASGVVWCTALSVIAVFGPNSNQIGNTLLAVCNSRPTTRALINGIGLAAVGFALFLNAMRDSVSAFIYFNF